MKLSFFLILILVGFGSPLNAQDLVNTIKETNFKENPGWGHRYRLSGNLSFNDNSKVVGKTDGLTSTFGLLNLMEGRYYRADHLWTYHFSLRQSFTKTPEISKLLKAEDQLLLSTEYLYFIFNSPSFGPFASLSLENPLFPSYDVRSDVNEYSISSVSGSVETRNSDELKLTESLKPLTLRQGLGLFFFPLEKNYLSLELRSGMEAKEIFAADQLAVVDNDSTPEIEIQELENIYLLNAAFSARALGGIKAVQYEAFADIGLPLVMNDSRQSDMKKIDLYQLNVGTKLISKLSNWFQLEYVFALKREPLIVDEFQLSHLIQFNFLVENFFGNWQPPEN